MPNNNWLLTPNVKPNSKLRIICFPYAGGNASTYLPWSNSLPAEVELVAIQPPGRANRIFEPPYTIMDALVNDLIESSEHLLDRPFILMGHSLGSRVAFEFMRCCRNLGLPTPVHFIASGSRGPHLPPRRKPVHALPQDEFIHTLKSLNGTPKEILEHSELMELHLPLLRADFELAETYLCKLKLIFDCPITAIGGLDDQDISTQDLKSWGTFFYQAPIIHEVEGGHFFIESNTAKVIKIVTKIIQKELANLKLRPNTVVSTTAYS